MSIKMTMGAMTLKKFQAKYKKRSSRLKNLKAAHKKISIFLDQWVQGNFKSEGGSVGGWEPFAPGNRRAAKDPSAKLLQDTGKLRASFVPFATLRDAGIGSDLPYSKKHEEGEDNLPQRRMLPRRREVTKDVRKIYDDHIRNSMK